jgi:hypothetical protein
MRMRRTVVYMTAPNVPSSCLGYNIYVLWHTSVVIQNAVPVLLRCPFVFSSLLLSRIEAL